MLVNFFFFPHILFYHYPPSSSVGTRRELKKRKQWCASPFDKKGHPGLAPPTCSHTQRMPLTRLPSSPSRRNKHLLPLKTSGKINQTCSSPLWFGCLRRCRPEMAPPLVAAVVAAATVRVHRTSRGGKHQNTRREERVLLSLHQRVCSLTHVHKEVHPVQQTDSYLPVPRREKEVVKRNRATTGEGGLKKRARYK